MAAGCQIAWLGLAVLLLASSSAMAQVQGRKQGQQQQQQQSASGQCANGCSRGERVPVCGTDGITYQARCVAVCAGVDVAYNGPCSGDDDKLFDAVGASGTFTPDDFAKYTAEGFKLVGKGKPDPNFQPTKPVMRMKPDGTPFDPQPNRGNGKSRAVRFDFDTNNVYVNDGQDAPTAPGTQDLGVSGTVDPAIGNAGGARRSLNAIIDIDNRTQVTATTTTPWNAIGLLLFNQGSSTYMCSGSLIKANYVLTAAHCVHSGAGGSFSTNMVFYPGRSYSTNPYGSFAYSSITMYKAYTTTGDLYYDAAVIKLKSSVPNSITLPFTLLASNTYSATTMFTAGYPGDKPYFTQWTTNCTVNDTSAADQVTEHYCDIYGGQSGSPAWAYYPSTGARGIRGIVSYEQCWCCSTDCSCCNQPSNWFQQMTSTRVNDISYWIKGTSTTGSVTASAGRRSLRRAHLRA